MWFTKSSKDVLKELMNRDYFLFSLYRLVSYVKEKEGLKLEQTTRFLENILTTLDKETEMRIFRELQDIAYYGNNLNTIEKYISNLSDEDAIKFTETLKEFESLDNCKSTTFLAIYNNILDERKVNFFSLLKCRRSLMCNNQEILM